MITHENVPTSHARCLIEIASVDIDAPGGRPLFRSLNMRLGRERVAIIGRNGGGKSSLLDVVAGHTDPKRGRAIRNGTVCLVVLATFAIRPLIPQG